MPEKHLILAVDDDPWILDFIQNSLSIFGYEVIYTTHGEQVAGLVSSKNPDLVIIDILMHPMTGFEILDKIRSFSQVPVIVFTAMEFIGSKAIEMGATDFIAKPFSPAELNKKIKKAISIRN